MDAEREEPAEAVAEREDAGVRETDEREEKEERMEPQPKTTAVASTKGAAVAPLATSGAASTKAPNSPRPSTASGSAAPTAAPVAAPAPAPPPAAAARRTAPGPSPSPRRLKRVWGFKKKLYVNLDPGEWADLDVEVLHRSMRGLGTDEADVIRVLANRNSAQVTEINKRFNAKYGARGNLLKWIESDTKGEFRNILTAMATATTEADADALNKIVKGLGDKSPALTILADRAPDHIARVLEAYDAKYNGKGGLDKWIQTETTGDLKDALLLLADRALTYAQLIQRALAARNALDTLILLQPLRGNDRIRAVLAANSDPLNIALDLTYDLEDELTTPTIPRLLAAYQQRFSTTLADAIRSAFSGATADLLLAQFDDLATRDVTAVDEALGRGSRDEISLIETLVLRSPSERAAIDAAYRRIRSTGLIEKLEGDSNLKFKRALLSLARPRAIVLATALKEAMQGGKRPDDNRLILLLTHRCKRDIREAAEAYKTLYQRPLVQDLHAATEGWYQKTLVYIVRESFELRVHVAKPWIQLQRDVDV